MRYMTPVDADGAPANERAVSETRYLRFMRETPPAGRKTPIVVVLSRSGGYALGQIRWYSAWRQFCFYPQPGCVFNTECMQDILDKIAELHEERRR